MGSVAKLALFAVVLTAGCNDQKFAGRTAKKTADAKPTSGSGSRSDSGSKEFAGRVEVPVDSTRDFTPTGAVVSGCKAADPKIVQCDPSTGELKGLKVGETKVTFQTQTGDQVVTVTVTPGFGTETGGAAAAGPGAETGGPDTGATTGSGAVAGGNPSIQVDEQEFACEKGQQGLVGKVYTLPPNTATLPNFAALTPIGQITALNLDVPARKWEDGFPALPGLIEWFAIKFFAQLEAPLDGAYVFQTISDDGSKVYIDDQLVLDNDGTHAPTAKESAPVTLSKGRHRLSVEWFQGPRVQIALQLGWKRPGDASFSFVPAQALKHGSDCALKGLGTFP